MGNFREFRIQNNSGQSYSLNGDSGIFLNDPAGLGMQDEIKTAELEYGFYKDLKNKIVPAGSITGDLLFINSSPYDLYRKFITFILRSEKLILSYKPYGSDEFFCNGRFEYLEKEELEETGILRVPINFIPFTPWYLPREASLYMRELTGGEMAYSFDYDSSETSSLVYASPLVGSYAAQINADGHIPAGIVFEYPGSVTDPTLKLVGANSDKELGKCAVVGTSTGFKFSSLYSDSYVTDSSGNSLLNGVSPGKDPFFRLPLDEPCNLILTAASQLTLNATAKIYYFFRSV